MGYVYLHEPLPWWYDLIGVATSAAGGVLGARYSRTPSLVVCSALISVQFRSMRIDNCHHFLLPLLAYLDLALALSCLAVADMTSCARCTSAAIFAASFAAAQCAHRVDVSCALHLCGHMHALLVVIGAA